MQSFGLEDGSLFLVERFHGFKSFAKQKLSPHCFSMQSYSNFCCINLSSEVGLYRGSSDSLCSME